MKPSEVASGAGSGPARYIVLARFEQGRGRTGIPWVYEPIDQFAIEDLTVEYVIHDIVTVLRAACVEAHGEDFLPGEESDYALHLTLGARLTRATRLNLLTWRSGEHYEEYPGIEARDQVLDTVLCYKLPDELLAGSG